VPVELSDGTVLTSSITSEAVDELGLRESDTVAAVVKASNVMIDK
jgi:molybdopterin-binding protein